MNLEEQNEFLIRQNRELRKMAEIAGSEMSVWKHKYIKLETEHLKLKSMIEHEQKLKKWGEQNFSK